MAAARSRRIYPNQGSRPDGIEFARREVRVALPSMEKGYELTPEDTAAISSAATQAAQ
ncbi:MAG: hypothetical protein V7730_18830 [Sulfitobacter sp.]